MEQSIEHRDVIIIGGGPAGLSAAVYLARAGLKPLIFAGSPPGGQLMLTSEVENFPGHEPILGSEFIQKLRNQVNKFGATIIDENVLEAHISKRPFEIKTLKNTYNAKSVLIATGAKALWLGLPSEKALRGKGVSACATCDGFFFRNKVVGVVGGGDSALEEALTLTKFASKVYLMHRKESLKASKIMQQRVFENKKIEVLFNTSVKEVLGTQKVEGVLLQSGKTLALEGLFVAIGHKPDTELVKSQIELDERGYVVTSKRAALEYAKGKKTDLKLFNLDYQTMTSVDGVFGAGDCVDVYYRQAATAAGMGVGASLDIERWLEQH